MDMNEKARAVCADAAAGKIDPDTFYDKLTAIADDTRTDDDLVCILEDVIMEIEMEHGCSKKKMRELIKDMAQRLLEEIQ